MCGNISKRIDRWEKGGHQPFRLNCTVKSKWIYEMMHDVKLCEKKSWFKKLEIIYRKDSCISRTFLFRQSFTIGFVIFCYINSIYIADKNKLSLLQILYARSALTIYNNVLAIHHPFTQPKWWARAIWSLKTVKMFTPAIERDSAIREKPLLDATFVSCS